MDSQNQSFVSSGVKFEIPNPNQSAVQTAEKEVQDAIQPVVVIPMPARQLSGLDVRLQKTCERNGIDCSTFLGIKEDEMRFVTFEHGAAIKVPPIKMGAQKVEYLHPKRMYFCSGAESKMLATVLALHKVQLIDVTPKQNQLNMDMQRITQHWSKL